MCVHKVCVLHSSAVNGSAGVRLPINYCALVNLIIFLSADLHGFTTTTLCVCISFFVYECVLYFSLFHLNPTPPSPLSPCLLFSALLEENSENPSSVFLSAPHLSSLLHVTLITCFGLLPPSLSVILFFLP